MMIQRVLLVISSVLIISSNSYADTFELSSPDEKIKAEVLVGEKVKYSLFFEENLVFSNNTIDVLLNEESKFAGKLKVKSLERNNLDELITPLIPNKSSRIDTECNELQLHFKHGITLVFRLYNNGFAYKFVTNSKDPLIVSEETFELNFTGNTSVYFPEEQSFYSHYENKYPLLELAGIEDGNFCSLPALFKTDEYINVLVSETDLYDYPCLFLKKNGSNSMKGIHPPVVKSVKANPNAPDRGEIIEAEENYIALTDGKRSFPWRTFIISNRDEDLLANNLNYVLAREAKDQDFSWVKPGMVAWDWYNANNIYHVDFEAGINTATYKYYIDFASSFGLDYIILDEGWSKSTLNVTESNPDINIPELINYGNEKNVGIILWLLWKPLDRDMELIMKKYHDWGVAGIKVDFMQRADQAMVNFYEKTAAMGAKYQLLVDFHGAFKPSGLRRAYPNVLTYEGVKGNENNKWSDEVSPEHTLLLPFTRMVAGPMDFTPGAMRNSNKENFLISFDRPMSLGTRAHQVAMYMIYESPLQMMCESPTIYYRESECAAFISSIPVTWDETVVLEASIGEFILLARRKDNRWYVGAMTNSTGRELELDLSFLPEGNYKLAAISDGINAERNAEDYKYTISNVRSGQHLPVQMSPGGGWAAIITAE